MPSTAASAPAMVVNVVTRAMSEEVRIWRESAIALRRSSTVLMTKAISLFLMMSTTCGRPSVTLLTAVTGKPACWMAAAVPLVGVTSIAPGESVVFFEATNIEVSGGTAGTTATTSFRNFWGGLAGVQVGYYNGSGIGLSSSGDGVVVFNSSGTEISQRVSFSAATTGSSFYYVFNASGTQLSTGNPVSAEGTVGAFKSVNALGNIGSPGASASSLELAFTSSLNKFAKVGQTYSSPITFQKKNGGDIATLSIVSGPAWLSLSNISQSGATLTGTWQL